MPEEQLWAMFVAACLAGNPSKPSEAWKRADDTVRAYAQRFPEAFRQYEDAAMYKARTDAEAGFQ